MKHDIETVIAYVDSELEPLARAEFESRLIKDHNLQKAVEHQRGLREEAVASSYDSVLEETTPGRRASAIVQSGMAPATPAAEATAASAAAPTPVAPPVPAGTRRWGWLEIGAMAGCLLLGLLVGWRSFVSPRSEPVLPEPLTVNASGLLVAQGPLARSLTQALSVDVKPEDTVMVGLSFMGLEGRYCRTFAFNRAQATTGLACMGASGQWEVHALAVADASALAASAPAIHRTAATALPPTVRARMDALRVGAVLDERAERAARDRGWQR